MRGLRQLSVGAVAGGLAVVFGALTLQLGGAAAQAPTIEDTVEGLVAAWNAGDGESFIGYFTAEGLADVVEVEPTVEAVEADMADTGPIASFEVSEVKIEGGVFTAIVDLQFEIGFVLYERWSFVDTDEGWVVSGGESASRPIPPGVPVVDLTLQEYAFVYEAAGLQAADGNFAFSVANAGEEEHEVVILGIDSDKPLLQLFEEADPESEDLPEGIELVTFGGFFEPGDSGTVVLAAPLASGSYALVCFLESPDGTPHAFLGMVSEFTIGGAITPPSTGDAGLQDGAATGVNWLILGLALTAFIGGAAGLVKSRVTSGA